MKVILKFMAENGRDNRQVSELVLNNPHFFNKNFIVKTCKTPLCTLKNTGNNVVLHNGSAKPTSFW